MNYQNEYEIFEIAFSCVNVDTVDYNINLIYSDPLLDNNKTYQDTFTVKTFGAILQLLDFMGQEIDTVCFDSCIYDDQRITRGVCLKNAGNLTLHLDPIRFTNDIEFISSRENKKFEINPNDTVLFPITFCPNYPHRRESEILFHIYDSYNNKRQAILDNDVSKSVEVFPIATPAPKIGTVIILVIFLPTVCID